VRVSCHNDPRTIRIHPFRRAAEVKKNPDGSVDLYIGPKAPVGQETNWIPTDPARQFEFMFRLYGPKPEFFEKKWKLPDVEKYTG
jgi:hypothetical protein